MASPWGWIGTGVVRHTRLRPVRNAFAYPTFFVLLPMRRWRAQPGGPLARNRRALLSFHDADHGDGGPDALAWFEALLAREGIEEADGEIWLHTYPRVLGYAFKPVSFWYALRRDGRPVAVLAEVNNTFGERHLYLHSGPSLAWGRELSSPKVFHVSPFCAVEGRYRFRFFCPDLQADRPEPARTVVRIEHDDASGPLLQTSVSGALAPLEAGTLSRAFWRQPLMTLGVIARIHLQALRLWRARVPFFRQPAAPDRPLTHIRPAPSRTTP